MKLLSVYIIFLISLDLGASTITCNIGVMLEEMGPSQFSQLSLDQNDDSNEEILLNYKFRLWDVPPMPGSPAKILSISKLNLSTREFDGIANLHYPIGRAELYPGNDIIIAVCWLN